MLPVLPILLVVLRLAEELSPTAVSQQDPDAALIRQQTRWRTAPEAATHQQRPYDARTYEEAQTNGETLTP